MLYKKIILLRHGEVAIPNYGNITAETFNGWVVKYNHSDVKNNFRCKQEIEMLLNSVNRVICSTLQRSIQSLKVFEEVPDEISELFDEVQLPNAKGRLLKLSPKIWLVIYRILWLLGYSKNCESFKASKTRAIIASKKLTSLVQNDEIVLLVGHGLMNKLIRKQLILAHWQETKKAKHNHWDYGVFELQIN